MPKKHAPAKIANLTLHPVTADMIAWGQGQGNEQLPTDPEDIHCDEMETVAVRPSTTFSAEKGIIVETWWTAYEVAKAASDAVWAAKKEGFDGILVGGATDLCYYEIAAAWDAGLRVFTAKTQRVRDANDRFVYQFLGLRELVPANRLFANIEAEEAE
jgi:hypothetical protein